MDPFSDKTNRRTRRIAISERSQQLTKKGKADSAGRKADGQLATQQVTKQVGSPSSVRKTSKASSGALPPRLPDTTPGNTPGSSPANSPRLPRIVSTDSFRAIWKDWDIGQDEFPSSEYEIPPTTKEYLAKAKEAVGQVLDDWEEEIQTGKEKGLNDFVTRTNAQRSAFFVRHIELFDRPESLGGPISHDQARRILRDGIEFLHAIAKGRDCKYYQESEDDFADNIAVFFAVLPHALDRASPDLLPQAAGLNAPQWELALRDISKAFNAMKFQG